MDKRHYQGHAIWDLLTQAKQGLSVILEKHGSQALLTESKSKVLFLQWIFEQSDPSLFSQRELDQNVQPELQHIVNNINQSASAPGRLSGIEDHFRNIVTKYPCPRVKKYFRSEVTEVASDFRAETDSIRSKLSSDVEQFNSKLDKLNALLNDVSGRLSDTSKGLETLNIRVDSQLLEWESEQKSQISERLTQINNEFSESQSLRREESETTLNKLNQNLEGARETLRELSETFSSKLEVSSAEVASWKEQAETTANKTLANIKNIYHVAGQTALAGDFEKAAKDEARLANIFSLLAGIFVIAAPIAFLVQWSRIDLPESDIVTIGAKLTAALAFFVPAAFFGTNSQRHRRVAVALRSLGIRVATFDAYLVNMEEEQRRGIKAEMASVFFSSEITPDRLRSVSSKEVGKTIDLASTILDKAEQVVKNVSPN
ncbi:MAG: hypothetical protein AB3N23_03935 [Paracoccaceae bacterium]